jgi:pimeloyl-ACP methyl ester carboxylesterase
MPTERFSTHGVELSWEAWGSGGECPLVLCHGFTGSTVDFSLQVEALAATRRVIALDQRGHGLSTKVGTTGGYSIDHLSDDLIAFIEHVGGGEPVDLLGHSMGGRVVLGVALARPDLIHSLILMDTSAWGFKPDDVALRDLMVGFITAYDPATGPPALNLRNPEDELIDAATPEEWRRTREGLMGGTDPYAFKALGMQLLDEQAMSVRDRLSEILCPVTVLVGEHDHPLVEQAPELAAELKDSELVVIEGAYHSPQLTHAERWRGALEAHLARTA